MSKLLAILRRMKPSDYALDLLAFAGTVTLALVFRWQARDLIWSLWISSLSFGFVWMFTAYICALVFVPGKAKLAVVAGGLFLMAFFTFHFGMFHMVHGAFLNEFFPLSPGIRGGMPSILTLAGTALAAYWPFVLMTLISRARDFPLGHKAMAGSSVMFQPYLNVIRMHILIFVFAGLQFAHLAHFALFPILLFYFFPWRVFNRERKGLASEAARAQSDR